MNLNHVVICGRLGKDPEFKQVNAEYKVVNFSLATTEKWKDKQSGELKEATEWINCQASNSQADVINQYVHKGDLLYVEGKYKTRSWDKDGVKQYATYVQVEMVQLFPKSKFEGSRLPPSESIKNIDNGGYEPDESDLPF